ncbi:MAG: HAD-IB family phosphatase [Muribaculaceae bacterium]|nr:HAD-IB family phosphatase [Muribaculaceae bacterium]MDE6321804.1 HAD-IB family phosphatase [Muribaculaceae bacterium]
MVTISAFDFDGTITRRDTLSLFIRHVVGLWRYYWLVTTMLIPIASALLGIGDRGKVKERLLGKVLGHMPLSQLQHYAYTFRIKYDNILRPKAIAKIRRALDMGHRVVVITASPEEWVSPFFADRRISVVGTQLADENGLLTGKFSTPNCYGAEKLRRLEALIPRDTWARLIAYGDSRGDKELLAAADEAHFRPFRK